MRVVTKLSVTVLTMAFWLVGETFANDRWTVERLQDELDVKTGWTVARELPTWSDKPTVLVSLEKPYAGGLSEAVHGMQL